MEDSRDEPEGDPYFLMEGAIREAIKTYLRRGGHDFLVINLLIETTSQVLAKVPDRNDARRWSESFSKELSRWEKKYCQR